MNKSVGTFLLTICIFLLTSCTRTVSLSDNSKICNLKLQVFVRQGPSANLAVSGQVAFGSNPWTSFKGDFVEENGLSHPISFYFDGQAVHFILDIEQGRIFGTGVMENGISTCDGNGGGTLSGPVLGDLGDWRGEWVSQANPTMPVQPDTNDQPISLSFLLCIYLPIAVVVLFLAIPLFRILAPYKLLNPFKTIRSPKNQASNVALRKLNQGIKSEPGKSGRPLAEYLVTYTADDKFFDLSFEIEKSSHYVGECGITTAKASDMNSKQAAALEIWLFDARDAQTVSKILAGDFCFRRENLRSELGQKGQVILIQPGETVTLETREIRAQANILQVEYEANSPNPQSAFKKVAIKIEVWANI
ncbi:MAG: hypothetical protein HY865_25195 [Chloroflexi bacterium]|nr:hypothetical protein [Chloroflexota bacterium]